MVKRYKVKIINASHQPALSVEIEGSNGLRGDIDLLIDTGAQQTTIDVNLVGVLGFELSKGKRSTIITASGKEVVTIIIVPLLKIGDIELLNHPVHVHDFKDFCNVSGVLGMDIISMYNFTLNQKERVAIFEEI